MWIVMVVDTDNPIRTPELYKAKDEYEAKSYLKETYKKNIEREEVFDLIDSFRWIEFGDNNLRLQTFFANGVIEDYIAMEISDSVVDNNVYVCIWFQDDDPVVYRKHRPASFKARTKSTLMSYARKRGVEFKNEVFVSEMEEGDFYVYESVDGTNVVVRVTELKDLNGKTFYNYEEFYE